MAELYRAIFDKIKKAVILTDGKKIVDVNQAFLDLMKLSNKRDATDNSYFQDFIKGVLADNSKAYTEINDRAGQTVSIEIVSTLIDRERNLYLVEINPTREEELYKEITMLATYSREMFDSFPDAMVILNDNSIIIDMNSAFEKLFGYKREEIIGHDIDELVNKPENRETGRKLFQQVTRNEKVKITGERLKKSGETFNVEICGYPVDIDKYTRGNCVIYKDISSEVQKEQELKEKEQFTDQLFNKSLFPIAILDREERVVNVNHQFEKLFEYQKTEIIGENINDLIVPEQHQEEAKKYLQRIFNNESMKDYTLRQKKSGELVEVEAVGNPITINDEIVGLFAMYRDVSIERRALRDLDRERAYFKQLFDNSPDPTALMNDQDRVVIVNPAFEKLFGYKLKEAEGVYIADLIAGKRFTKQANDILKQVTETGKTLRIETIRTSKDGREIDVELITFPIFLEGDRIGVYAIYQDITERKTREREVQELAYRDSLTGVPNRLYAYESVAVKIEKAKESNEKVALVYFDLDGFKDINDAHGHKTGDVVLRVVAERLKEAFEGRMEICRVGGDEFLGIIDRPSTKSLDNYTADLKALFENDFLIDRKSFRLGLSIGSSIYPDDGLEPDHLISKADSRMYDEKRKSRIKRYPVRKTTILDDLDQ